MAYSIQIDEKGKNAKIFLEFVKTLDFVTNVKKKLVEKTSLKKI
jgi:hypothetical protein